MTGEHDRYRAAGLTRNPFSIEMHDSESGVLDDACFVFRGLADPPPARSKTLVQVIGDQGVGKSTHLRHWQRRHPGPYHYIPRSPYRQRWTPPPVAPVVYGDEIDRMPRPLRLRWFSQLARMNATLVIGTHADLRRLGRAVGFSVVTHELGRVGREQLRAVLDRRLEAAKLPGSRHVFRFSDEDLVRVLTLSKGNLRAADSVCHRIVAQRVSQRRA